MGLITVKAFLVAAMALSAWAEPAGNINVTALDGEKYSCGTECREAVNTGTVEDRLDTGADFDFDFYATAKNFSTSLKPGEILKLEAIDPEPRDIKPGTTIYRMQYVTEGINGTIVPSTGFIAFPYAPSVPARNAAEGAKYPLVAYAHGTIGLYRACAPSNGVSLYDYDTWQALVARGYAVVATDYAGLGNNYTTHKYLNHPTHANDIKFSVVAARQVFGELFTKEWMSTGRSQGGGAVWKLAESEHVRDDPDYLGTVAIAPSTNSVDMILEYVEKAASSGNSTSSARLGRRAEQDINSGYLALQVAAAERTLLWYKENLLSQTMKRRVQMSDQNGLCKSAMLTIGTGLGLEELVNVDRFAEEMAILQQFQNATSAARGGSSPAPVLVIQGTADITILPNTTVDAWRASCEAGNEVHLRLYEEMDHRPVQTAATPEFLGWMDALFAGRARLQATYSGNCTTATRKAMDGKYVKLATTDS